MALFTCKSDLTAAEALQAKSFEDEQVMEAQLRRLLETQLPHLLPQRRLMVIAPEYSNWSNASRFIDLLALDAEGRLVVVEIKRTGDGGHAELQALRYAAMLSTHTLDNVIDARHRHLQRSQPRLSRDEAAAEVLEFLGKSDPGEVTLGTTPHVILIARDFSPEITTTAMWLMERVEDFLMHCFTVRLYPLGDGRHALHFDLLLPLPQQQDYLVKVRDKNAEIARQSEGLRRRQRTCQMLEAAGQLKVGDTLHLVKTVHRELPPLAAEDRRAVYRGGGKVEWRGKLCSSLTAVTLEIRNRVDPPVDVIPGTDYWGLHEGGPSLAVLASSVDGSAA